MKIVIPKKMCIKLKKELNRMGFYETRGSFFAERVNDDLFVINDIYFSRKQGTVSFIQMIIGSDYHRFQNIYHKKHKFEYKKFNFIGDWHSHPSFSCNPSRYDVKEAKDDLEHSNANFIVQCILKLINNNLTGNAYVYYRDRKTEEIDLIIKQ